MYKRQGVDREIFTLCKNEKYGQLIENLENVEGSASQMADFALSGQTVAQQITMLAGLTAEEDVYKRQSWMRSPLTRCWSWHLWVHRC